MTTQQKFLIIIAAIMLSSIALFAQPTSGGPDEFGYSWVSSNNAAGPEYSWIEAPGENEITTFSDDNVVGPIDIGFAFDFYDEAYSQFWISSNGWISFTETTNSDLGNDPIPSDGGNNNLIAWFWDDLDPADNPNGDTHIYYDTVDYGDGEAFMLTFEHYHEYPGNNDGEVTAQLLLVNNGDIVINYQSFDNGIDIAGSTIGIENLDGTDGLQYVNNGDGGVLENEMTILFSYPEAQDNDLQAYSFTGPSIADVGEEVTYTFEVRNRGLLTQNTYQVVLSNGLGTQLDTQTATAPIAPEEIVSFDLSFTPTAEMAGENEIIAEVVLATDQEPLNNAASMVSYFQYVATNDIAAQEYSIYFDGTANDVTIQNSESLNFTDEDSYTLEAWINPQEFGYYDGIISKYASYNTPSYTLRLGGNYSNGYNQLNFDGMDSPAEILTLGDWYHVAAVKDGAERRLYVNGVEVPLEGTPIAIQASENPVRIGNDYGYRRFKGHIDDARIWNVARTEEEILATYQNQIAETPEGLVAYYPMTTGFGNTVYDNAGANTGELMGTANWISTSPFAFLTGPAETAENVPTEMEFTVYNNGTATVNSYTISLETADGTELSSETINVPLAAKQSAMNTISFTPQTGIQGDTEIVGHVTSTTDEVLTNNYTSTMIYVNPEHDLELVGLTGNPETAVNNETVFDVSVLCNGTTETSYQIFLKDTEENILATENYTTPITTGETAIRQIAWTPSAEYVDSTLTVYATVVVAGDPLPENDDSPTFSFYINSEYDLEALSLSGSPSPIAGGTETYMVSIRNNGVPVSSFTCTLKDTLNNVLAVEEISYYLDNFEIAEFPLTFTPAEEGGTGIYAEVTHAADLVPGNNTTAPIEINVQPAGTVNTQIGNGESTWNTGPYDLWYMDSINEIIYYPEEIGYDSGTINGISFEKNFPEDNLDKPVEIYVGETEENEITEWITAENMTMVLSGTVDFMAGEGWHTFTFDTPYEYTGGNLIVMIYRDDSAYYSSQNYWYYEETPEYPNRWGEDHTDNSGGPAYDPMEVPASPTYFSRVPNTQLLIEAETGIIEGHAYDEDGNPLSNVFISKADNEGGVMTDSDGFYRQYGVTTGTFDFVASKYGYYDDTMSGMTVISGNTTVMDFTMLMLENVVVEGNVIESDTQEAAVDARVVLSGYATYETQTDENGEFTIPGVYASQTYNIFVEYEGYQDYVSNVEIGTDDPTVLDEIIVEEIAFPPSNVVIEQNEEDTAILMTWDAPVIRNQSRTNNYQYRRETQSRVHVGYNIYRVPFGEEYDPDETNWEQVNAETVTETSYTDTSWDEVDAGAFRYTVKAVYTNGVLSDAAISNWVEKNMSATLVLNVTTNDGVDPEGAEVSIMATLPAPDGSFPSSSGTVEGGQLTLTNVYKTSYNLTATYPGYEVLNQEIVVDEDLTTIDIMITEIRYMPYGTAAEVTVMDEEVSINWNPPVTPTRVRLGYNVYRIPWGDQTSETQETWELLNAEVLTDTAYVDTDWTNVYTGSYIYGVKAVYTSMVESDADISNYVEKNMYATVDVTVLTNDESIPEGAEVNLTATLPNPAGIIVQSNGVVGADGTVTITNVYKTSYNMQVTYPGFATLTTPVVVDDDAEEFEVMINELLLPPANVVAASNDDDTELTLTWDVPVTRSMEEYRKSLMGDANQQSKRQNSLNLVDVANQSARNSRYVETYSIYRFELDDQSDPTLWDSIATVSELTYVDTEWGTIDPGLYKYAVKANYTGNLPSPPTLSNWIGQGLFTNIMVNVNSFYDNPIEGALVQLEGLTTDPEGNTYDYEVTTTAAGEAFFPSVFKGLYNIYVTKEGFVPFSIETVSIQTASEVTYQISEPLNPIAELEGEVVGNGVSLSWAAPSAITQFDFEANDGGFTADNGWEWGTTDSLTAHSGTNVWATTPNSYYENNADYSLLSTEFTVQVGMQLEFYTNYDTEENYDGFNCKITTDGGTTWTLIEPVGGYPSIENNGEAAYGGNSEGWVLATFDLSEYDGSTAQIKWHFQSDSSVNNYNGVAIDDVFMGIELLRDFTLNSQVASRSAVKRSRNSRALEGFNIYRNDTQIATNHPTTSYLDENLENGDYTYMITANYTTGESIADTISFAVYPVTVSANVYGTDAPDTGMDDVYGILYNDNFSYETYSEAGDLSFEYIQGNQTYNLVIYKPGYEIHVEENPIVTVSDDIELDDVILTEVANPPEYVVAEFNEIGTEATVSWSGFANTDDVFRHDDGDIVNQVGIGANPYTVFASAHRHIGILNSIEWYLSSSIVSHDEVKLFVFALDENGNATTEILFESEMIPNVDDEWNLYQLPKVIICDYGFMVGVSTPNVNTGIGADDGVGDPYIFETNTQMVIDNYMTGDWTDIDTYDIPYNLAIRGYGIDYGEIEYPEEMASRRQPVEENDSQNEREFESYTVYRLLSSLINNPAAWTTIAENVTDTTLVDPTWFELNQGAYYYAITSNHTNGIASDAQFTDQLLKEMTPEYDVDFTVDPGDGGSPAGAVITLTNQNEMEDYVYTESVPANGEISLDDVVIGFYELTVELTDYPTYTDTILVDQNMNLDIVLVIGNDGDATEVYNTSLIGNYPNPFNPTTTINFSLANDAAVKIDIYNVRGQKIRTVANDEFEAGMHQVIWNGKDDNNRQVSSGMYFYKLRTENYSKVKKMLMLK